MKFGNSLSTRQATYGRTTVTCNEDRGMLDNSLHQNPCLTYAWMVGSCASIIVQVDPLDNSNSYPAPVNDSSQGVLSASKCTCQRVSYNLASACASCQNKTEYLSWNSWAVNCDGYTGQWDFTKNVPEGTALPIWATGQTNSDRFDWDTAVKALGGPDFLPSANNGSSSNSGPIPTTLPSNTTRSPQIESVPITASVTLSAVAVGLFCLIVVAFVMLRRKNSTDDYHDKNQTQGSSSILHPILMTIVLLLGLILACTSTWTSALISAGTRWTGNRSTLNFLVFASWWTVLTGAYFLLAFQIDLRRRQQQLQQNYSRLAPLQAHILWIASTWAFWAVLASLFVVSLVQKGRYCKPFCGHIMVITVVSFMELLTLSILLVMVAISHIKSVRKKPSKNLYASAPKSRRRR